MSDSKPSLSDLRIDDHARYSGSGRMGLALLVLAAAAVAGAALGSGSAPRVPYQSAS